MHRYSVIACARWETPYIREWLAYYKAIGFDHVYLHCNDDDPAEFAAEVASATRDRPGFVTFTHFSGQGRQRDMYVDAMRRARDETEWVTFLDIDEFLVLRGFDDVHAFMQPFAGSFDSVHFNWVYFGNNGFIKRPPGEVLPQYTVRQSVINPNTKHLTRAAKLSADQLVASSFPFWHGLADPEWSDLRRVNVLRSDIGPLLKGFPKVSDAYVSDPGIRDALLSKAIVNHYAFKSEADFLIRANRGSGGDFAAQARWRTAYESGNFRGILDGLNEVEDTYLAQFSARMFPGGSPAAPVRVPLPPVRTVRVRHRLWSADVQLGANGRVRHGQHGSLGSYRMIDGVLQVKWDDWSNEDLFVEQGDAFMSAEAATISQPG